jgi:hypothetical protein
VWLERIQFSESASLARFTLLVGVVLALLVYTGPSFAQLIL